MGSGGFADFYQSVWSDLAGYATSLVRDPDVAQDLTQEALTRVYARWALLREPRSYAFRIVTNLAHDRYSAQTRERRTVEQLAAAPQEAGEAADVSLLDAVRRLGATHRDLLLLYYWTDLSVSDIARAQRRPAGTIKRRLSEARQALAAQLAETS